MPKSIRNNKNYYYTHAQGRRTLYTSIEMFYKNKTTIPEFTLNLRHKKFALGANIIFRTRREIKTKQTNKSIQQKNTIYFI